MTFAWPHFLWLLAVPLLLLAFEGRRTLRSAKNGNHGKIIRAQAGASRVALLGTEEAPAKRRLPRFWLAAGLVLAIVALARPQWGHFEEQVFDQSREIMIALDLSRSMNSTDVKPTRLDRAKLLTRSLLDRLSGERVGLVVFAGTAFVQSPLSADYEILEEFLPELKPGYLPEGGTNYGDLLKESVDAFDKTGDADRFLIILSDGEALDEGWRNYLPLLREKGIRVIGLGVGTLEGSMIPDEDGSFVKDERGAVVMSRLEPTTLQALANETRGAYRDASVWVDIPALLKATVETGKQGAFTEKRAPRAIDRFQWVLGPALVCLLASLFFEFPAPIKPRAISTVAGKAAAASGKVVSLLLFVMGALCLGSLRLDAAEEKAASKTSEPPLVATIRRLSEKDTLTPADCANLAKRTIEWGQGLQSAQQPVPDGPVRDGLDAVSLGENLDAKAADWPRLRRELEALRRHSDSQPRQNDQKQDQPKQKKDQQDKQQQQQQKQEQQSPQQQQKQQDQNSPQPQDQQKSPQQERSQQNPEDQQKKQDPGQQGQQSPPQQQQKQPEGQKGEKPPERNGGDSAFGNIDPKDNKPAPKPEQPPQPRPQPTPDDMQKVGGGEKKPSPEQADPSLVIPLEKLDKAREKDNPGQLFEMMRDNKSGNSPSNKKNW